MRCAGVRGPGHREDRVRGKRPGHRESVNGLSGQRPGGRQDPVTKSVHEREGPDMVKVVSHGCVVGGVRGPSTRSPPIDGTDRGAEARVIVYVGRHKGPRREV